MYQCMSILILYMTVDRAEVGICSTVSKNSVLTYFIMKRGRIMDE